MNPSESTSSSSRSSAIPPHLPDPGSQGLTVLPVDGRVPYRQGLEWQRAVARRRIDGHLDRDLLILLEHEPVLTQGRNAAAEHLAVSEEALRAESMERVEVERGGDVTYHGPGQLVGYPILDLRDHRKDLHWYLRTLEDALMDALEGLGRPSFRAEGFTGIWVGEPGDALVDRTVREEAATSLIPEGAIRKVASIGVHVSRWITWHGFALNVTDEPLERFGLVVPCGIPGVRMTSLASEGIDAGMPAVRETVAAAVAAALDIEPDVRRPVAWGELYGETRPRAAAG